MYENIPKSKNQPKTFMDFCAGIGGGRLGLTSNGLSCVAYSEIDDKADSTYKILHGYSEQNYGDLMKVDTNTLPYFDILIGGFPCQTFSIVGKREGFNDNRGQIIYGIIKILKEKNIPYFILENVKGLINHDNGKTLATIIKELNSMGYYVQHKVLNSCDYGVPQMRERVYIVGMKEGFYNKTFQFPKTKTMPSLKNFLISQDDKLIFDVQNKTFQKYLNNKYNKGKFNIKKLLQNEYTILDTRQSDLRLYPDKCPTLRTGRHGILYVKNNQLRKLSGIESLLLQGFPIEIANKLTNTNIKDNKLLSQAGNAMTVNVIKVLGEELLKCCI